MSTIDDVLRREGDKDTNDPLDEGGRTKFGISEKANPEAWADGVVTEDEARAIYERKYIKGPGFDKIPDAHLRNQLIDFGVNSGPSVAIGKLQEVLGVTVDHVIGPETLGALSKIPSALVSTQLVAARIKMICRIVTKNPTQLKWLNGWVNRALEFL